MNDVDNDNAKRAWQLVLDSLEAGKDFVVEQAPLVVQELIAWKRFWYTFLAVLCILAIPAGLKAGATFNRWRKETAEKSPYDDAVTGWAAATVVSWVASVIAGGAAMYNIYYASMVWIAPRVFLIEYLSNLLKK